MDRRGGGRGGTSCGWTMTHQPTIAQPWWPDGSGGKSCREAFETRLDGWRVLSHAYIWLSSAYAFFFPSSTELYPRHLCLIRLLSI